MSLRLDREGWFVTYHEDRMVLRDSAHEFGPVAGIIPFEPAEASIRGLVELIVGKAQWPLIESNDEEQDASYRCYRLWGAAPGLWVMYLEDLTTRVGILVLFGEHAADVAELSRRLRLMFSLDPYSREELLADAARLQGEEKVRAIVRVALAMGDGFDPEYFAAISAAARDADPQVRNAAAWSTGYLECPESMELLVEIAANDPHDEVRQSAKELLADFN